MHPTAPSAPGLPAGTGSPKPSAGSGSASAASEITADWNAFFSSATSTSRRVQLLQNGSAFASSIKAFASSPLAAAVTSKVDSVTVSSATQAKVKYDLSALGKTVAKDASGTAVRQDGTWQVGDDVFLRPAPPGQERGPVHRGALGVQLAQLSGPVLAARGRHATARDHTGGHPVRLLVRA